ncbi:MAG: hypothetical protein KAQ68_08075, partial [Clostridiales bacterium]|nr:hypothetical protein [Clostridiales bacterium]
ETLDSLDTEAYQFALDIIIDKLTYCDYASVEYLPKQHTGGIWSCCCGRVNKDEWSICCYCGRDKQKQFDILDVRYLNEIATQQLKEKEEKDKVDMKRREKERQQREESVTRAKVKRKELYERQLEIERKRKIKGIIIAVVVVVAFISILILLSQ